MRLSQYYSWCVYQVSEGVEENNLPIAIFGHQNDAEVFADAMDKIYASIRWIVSSTGLPGELPSLTTDEEN